ncbi:MAG: hypothetical protein E6J62_21480 [Deltaproteobacteria bacterium]|nr:MAG: hypothetical protein E6J62_21480 [Deltaproteobacteria bacterium]
MGVLRYALGTIAPRLGRAAAPTIFCGTSVGAINACALAARAEADDFGVAHVDSRRRCLAARRGAPRRTGPRRDPLAPPAREHRLRPRAGGDHLRHGSRDGTHRGVRRARRRGSDSDHRCGRGMGPGAPPPPARSRLGGPSHRLSHRPRRRAHLHRRQRAPEHADRSGHPARLRPGAGDRLARQSRDSLRACLRAAGAPRAEEPVVAALPLRQGARCPASRSRRERPRQPAPREQRAAGDRPRRPRRAARRARPGRGGRRDAAGPRSVHPSLARSLPAGRRRAAPPRRTGKAERARRLSHAPDRRVGRGG